MTASAFPSAWARVMASSTYTLHRKETPEPRATSVSMFGAPCRTLLKPLIKNFWLMTMMIAARSICTMPTATWLPSKKRGRGQPHIMCPMEKYMSTMRKPREAIRRFFRTGVSRSASSSEPGEGEALCAPFLDAP